MLAASSAYAALAFIPQNEFVAGATDIVAGNIVAAESRFTSNGNLIVTDVSVDVSQSAKGAVNEKQLLTFTVTGGRVGGLVMQASELPTFTAGEDVVLYLRETEDGTIVLYGGIRGKLKVTTDSKSGEQTVAPSAFLSISGAKSEECAHASHEDGVACGAALAETDRMTVDEYIAYVRALDADYKAQQQADEEAAP